MNRKLKKLIKTPRLYFVDMFKKKLAKGSLSVKYLPMLKVQGNYKFSVVSAVYGVEKYLEQYFLSIENQTLSFVDHIELIMVDDGSLDRSADIIKKWVKKYPDNIKYVKKENGGQASARNVGMEHVSNDWVTFIDPDDFLSVNYFSEVDRFLSKENDIAMVSCNFIFYIENKDVFSDSHPLKYRFNNKELILNVNNMKQHVQLSVNSAFFRTEIIRNNNLEMDSRIKPNFEDAHFVGKYLLSVNYLRAGFLKEAKYFYRKREDNTSTLDGAWQKETMYFEKLKYGDLELLQYSENKFNEIPEYIQRIVLYDLFWYVRYIVNNSFKLSFLEKEQKKVFLELLNDIFSKIDIKVIDKFELAGCWFYHKVGLLGLFKETMPKFQILYVEDYDVTKKLIKIRYFYNGSMPLESFYFDGVETTPVYAKLIEHDFIGKSFVSERILWLLAEDESQLLRAQIDDIDTRLTFLGHQSDAGIPIRKIVEHYNKKSLDNNVEDKNTRSLRLASRSYEIINKFNDAWLFMDRDIQADDNAEHLYRYVIKHHSDVNAFFILSKESKDWARLNKEGFNLIDFDSQDHKLALLNAKHLISSHVDHYVTDLLAKELFGDMLRYHFTFLQHGIIQNDLSVWLNTKTIDLFITSTKDEFDSISGNDKSRYKFSNKEVLLTGLPRHDQLLNLNKNTASQKTILIMPTWRNSLVGDANVNGTQRNINEDFYSSDYAILWKSLLHSAEFKKQVDSYGFEVVFFPHTNIQPYLDWFEAPGYIKTIAHSDIESMQHLFCEASVLLTDYSSVAFDMAYLNKAIIYYQFDYDFVFGGGHTSSEGYYKYERDGFGPVCFTETELLTTITDVLDNGGLPEKHYLDRIESTFVRRDGLCCQRVYEGIARLEKPELFDNQQSVLAVEYAKKATAVKKWLLASKRWENIYKDTELSNEGLLQAGLALIRNCRLDGRLGEAKKWINDANVRWSEANIIDKIKGDLDHEWMLIVLSTYHWEKIFENWQNAHSSMSSGDWKEAMVHWNKITHEYLAGQILIDFIFNKIECLAQLGEWGTVQTEIEVLKAITLSENERVILESWEFAVAGKLSSAIELLQSLDHDFEKSSYYYSALVFFSSKEENYSNVILYQSHLVKIRSSELTSLSSNKESFPEMRVDIDNWLLGRQDLSTIELNSFEQALRYYEYDEKADIVLNAALQLSSNDEN